MSMSEQSLRADFDLLRRASAYVAVAAASVALLGPSEALAADDDVHSVAAVVSPLCPAPPDTAEGMTTLMGRVKGWDSGDGITSVRLPSGAIIISTGDNMGTDALGHSRFRRNALLSVCGDKAKTIIGDGEIIPSVKGEWYWPGEMVADEQQGKLYVFSSRMAKVRDTNEQNGADLGAFTGVGVDLAVFSLPTSANEDPQFMYMAKTPASNSPEVGSDGIRYSKQWGASVLEGNDGYLYVYGSLMETRTYSMARDAYVARVKAGQLESPEAWEYYAGDGWSNDESIASPVIDSKHQPGLDASWTTSYDDGRVTIVSKRDGIYGTELGEWSASSPIGPFTYRKLADLPPYDPKAMTYNAHTHPAITLKYGGMLVSICQNSSNGDLAHAKNNPADYLPLWLNTHELSR